MKEDDIDEVMELVYNTEIPSPWWYWDNIPDDVKNAFADSEKSIRKEMDEKVKDITETIFVDILKFEREKLEKVADIIGTTMDIIKFRDDLPTQELQDIAILFEKICIWRERQKVNEDRSITINPNTILRAKSKVVDLKMKLWKAVAYYKSLNDWYTVNRRATRSATSIAIRQFSWDMEKNIKSLLTVWDSENFWELLSSKMNLWSMYAWFVYNYLNEISNNMKIIIEDMQSVINQIKFDNRIWNMT